MIDRASERRLPPYVPYRTWKRFLEKAKEEAPLPPRLDTSFWARLPFSGSNESALKRALISLDLTTPQAETKETLEKLVRAEEGERTQILRQIVSHSYSDLFSHVEVRRATIKELQQYFKDLGADGDIGKKCISFFLAIAQESGFDLHPSLKRPAVSGRRGRFAKNGPPRGGTKKPKVYSLDSDDGSETTLQKLHSVMRALLKELPPPGNQWPQKAQWKRTWEALLDLIYPEEQ